MVTRSDRRLGVVVDKWIVDYLGRNLRCPVSVLIKSRQPRPKPELEPAAGVLWPRTSTYYR